MKEVVELAYRDTIGLIEALRIINEALNDTKLMDEALVRVMVAIEKGATSVPDKQGST